MDKDVKELCNTLKPITDFSTLKKGEKIFNRHSLNIEFIDTFNHIENWDEEREIIFYKNIKGELWNGETKDNWYYYNK